MVHEDCIKKQADTCFAFDKSKGRLLQLNPHKCRKLKTLTLLPFSFTNCFPNWQKPVRQSKKPHNKLTILSGQLEGIGVTSIDRSPTSVTRNSAPIDQDNLWIMATLVVRKALSVWSLRAHSIDFPRLA